MIMAFLKFLISVRGGLCDNLLWAPNKPSYATDRMFVTVFITAIH